MAAGRFKRIAAAKRRSKVRHGADEIADIEQGADLGRLLPSELAKPEFSVAIGMLLYTHRTQVRKASEEQGLAQKLKSIFAGSF